MRVWSGFKRLRT